MKVKVVESFIDKHTHEVHPVDEVFECDEKRYQEITKAGHYVDVVVEPKKEAKASK
ncbi:hypothetical protein [Bacillus infantis]|uniref:hypothetical protein n=1 Tax=Bacillus infantis TaxID=324767 RepID=UPI003CF79A69